MNIMKKENEHNSMKPKNLLLSILIDMEKSPGKEVFHEYFMLFETAEEAQKMMYLE